VLDMGLEMEKKDLRPKPFSDSQQRSMVEYASTSTPPSLHSTLIVNQEEENLIPNDVGNSFLETLKDQQVWKHKVVGSSKEDQKEEAEIGNDEPMPSPHPPNPYPYPHHRPQNVIKQANSSSFVNRNQQKYQSVLNPAFLNPEKAMAILSKSYTTPIHPTMDCYEDTSQNMLEPEKEIMAELKIGDGPSFHSTKRLERMLTECMVQELNPEDITVHPEEMGTAVNVKREEKQYQVLTKVEVPETPKKFRIVKKQISTKWKEGLEFKPMINDPVLESYRDEANMREPIIRTTKGIYYEQVVEDIGQTRGNRQFAKQEKIIAPVVPSVIMPAQLYIDNWM
jgi:hypothetical protein